MEWDDERSGGFEPLRFLPKGEKQVVLGLVTTKRGELESKDDLKRRIEEAARYAPFDQLCLSGQCGFSSTVEGNVLTQEQQWEKLRLIVEVAEEVRRLGELGCTYLQLDDTSLAYMNDPHQREYVASIGGDPDRQHVEYIHHINEALAGRPEGMSVTTHMCRGNFRSSWVAEGGYEFVADALFNELEVDGFFMEWDDERSGGFEPLRLVPPGKFVVLGLVTTKRGELEQKDDLKRRIDEASKFVPLEQLCLSPQCGFSSTVEGNALTVDEERAKLRLIVETAEEIWG
jgi:5-methyltetrahydropteroyltriglutamate--homocysteine methyltransferase